MSNNDTELYKLPLDGFKNIMKSTILVVDDDPLNISVIERGLRKFKIKLYKAENGLAALDILNRHKDKIDIVLMDLMMPIMNGFIATKEIKINDELKHLPVIVITAFSDEETKTECYKLGCCDFISKPFDLFLLFDKINKWILKNNK